METIRLMLAEDHVIVRAGVRSLVKREPDMEVVAEAADEAQALEQALHLTPDVVVMDLLLPRLGGVEATRQLKLALPSCRVLALSGEKGEELLLPVLQAGAAGYIPMEAKPAELVSAIRTVYSGQLFIPANGHGHNGGGRNGGGAFSLTHREREVLDLTVQGFTNREIALSLFLSVKAVEKHRASLMDKLGLRRRAELIRFAFTHDLD